MQVTELVGWRKMNPLVNAERVYLETINRDSVDIQKAINHNSEYYERLFNLYRSTENIEDRIELAQELGYLNQQLSVLHHTKLLQGGIA